MTNRSALDWFNWIVVALVSLVVLVAAVVMLAAPGQVAGFLSGLAGSLASPSATTDLARTLAAMPGVVAAGAIALIVLVVELWPRHPERRLIVPIEAGAAEYPVAIVASAIDDDVLAMEGVRGARVQLESQGRKVNAFVRLWLDNGTGTQSVTTQVGNRVRDKIRAMGFEPGAVRVAIQTTKLDVPGEAHTAA